MSIGKRLGGIVVLAASVVVSAQTTGTKPLDGGGSLTTQMHLPGTPAQTPPRSEARYQAEILTDTMGVDFGPYLIQIMKTVRQNWYAVMPPSVYPPIKKQGKVSIEFGVLKDGKVDGMKVHVPSFDVALNRAAWASITASNPFPPLPKEFPGQLLGLRFYFFYNLSPDIGISPISISPSADVRVPAGSTLQFSASGKGTTDTSVTWSVSGPGCSKSTCGTISDTGLYTAPLDVPNPPTVNVEATSQIDMSVTGKSKLTVVQASPSH
jgi:TonB family protein